MKTTVNLPDDLLIEAKKRAAEERRSLGSLFSAGLRAELDKKPLRQRRRRQPLRWVTVRGGLPPVDVSDREQMHDWLRRQR